MRSNHASKEIQTDDRTSFKAAQVYIRDTRGTQVPTERCRLCQPITPWILNITDTQRGVLTGLSRERNLRSKIWWFTEFCNSHYVSHFAAFFIVTGTKISVAKSCIVFVFLTPFEHQKWLVQFWTRCEKKRKSHSAKKEAMTLLRPFLNPDPSSRMDLTGAGSYVMCTDGW